MAAITNLNEKSKAAFLNVMAKKLTDIQKMKKSGSADVFNKDRVREELLKDDKRLKSPSDLLPSNIGTSVFMTALSSSDENMTRKTIQPPRINLALHTKNTDMSLNDDDSSPEVLPMPRYFTK